MASSATSSLRLEKQGVGENDNTWGVKLNTDMDLIDDAIAGYTTIALGGSSYTLNTADFASDEARHTMLEFSGALVSAISVIIPGVSKTYDIRNRTTGGFNTTVRQSGGSGFAVPQGTNVRLLTDGVTVVAAGYPVSADQSTIDAKIQAVGDVRYAQVSVSSAFTNPIFMVSAAINEAKSFTITAAATIDLMSTTGNFVDVSGETNIVSFGSAVAGTRRLIRAVTTVNLTNNNNTLLLEGKANTFLVPQDSAEAIALGGLAWQVPDIKRRVRPKFSARAATGQLIPAGSLATKIEFNTEEFDNNDNYSTANYRFVPSVPGIYQVNGMFTILSLSAGRFLSIHIYKNGSKIKTSFIAAPTSDSYMAAVNQLVDMNGTTDFLEIYGETNDTVARNVRTESFLSHFSACLVN